MADNKTQPTRKSAAKFVKSIEHAGRQADGLALLDLFDRVTGLKPVMWGDSLIGYGRYHYKYDSGREGDFFLTGFSPRKQNLAIYIMDGFSDRKTQALLGKLGKHKTGGSCLYINKLADVDLKVLETLVQNSVAEMKQRYPTS